MHALLIRHNYVAKHVTPSTHPLPPTSHSPSVLFKRRGVMGDITWLISTVLSWKLSAKDDRRYKHHQSASASHSGFNVRRRGRAMRSNERLQIMLGGAGRGGSIIYTLLFRLLLSARPSSTPVLICDQRLSTFCQRDRRDVARGEEPLGGIMTLKGSVAKSGSSTSQPDFYWCIREIAYCLQENRSWGFFETLTKLIVCCSFVHGGRNAWTTFCDTVIRRDHLV